MKRFSKSLALLAATALITGAAGASYAGPPKKPNSGGSKTSQSMAKARGTGGSLRSSLNGLARFWEV
jgi:hypothetical protein